MCLKCFISAITTEMCGINTDAWSSQHEGGHNKKQRERETIHTSMG